MKKIVAFVIVALVALCAIMKWGTEDNYTFYFNCTEHENCVESFRYDEEGNLLDITHTILHDNDVEEQ